ncbi:efflux RND transporter periplasmic adaptor subunit [Parabacteroides sp. AM08-6]|uniref:efflux RND transporter periplasmic adaptor subunit n=1 Tax=Parabacteroides sp. AM08-6 TaxID=2292053 RepID=UPI000EFEAC83|nr:efflux RND transporter periplasmic adaptor subunit [Parabacteroides sp. AM08-6]RHJ75745.1 efflux RND transporter periplasmic adaptor subunit [Parabacteroides sp. AM08-6]
MWKKNTLHLALLSMLLLAGCKSNIEEKESNNYQHKGDTIIVTSRTLNEKLKVAETQLLPYSKEVVTAGTVQAIPTQFAYVAPPFSGRVMKSYIHLGQQVEEGTPLFEISSPDFTSAQKEFFQARLSRELAQKDFRRKQDLIENGVSSQKELEEAENTLLIAEKEYENAIAALYVYQVNEPENMTLGQPLIVRAPISGNIIENNIVTGQYLKDDAEPIAVVADLSKVWITAQVKEKDIRFIKEGNKLNIEISAFPGKHIEGTVFHVEESVDESTRSIRVLSICDNQKEMLKLGMYTTMHFISEPTDMIHIPEKALLQGEKDSYVYVQTSKNTYIRRPVEVEFSKEGQAVIASGLQKDEKVISEGGYYLK